jgi:hypothetical protein
MYSSEILKIPGKLEFYGEFEFYGQNSRKFACGEPAWPGYRCGEVYIPDILSQTRMTGRFLIQSIPYIRSVLVRLLRVLFR